MQASTAAVVISVALAIFADRAATAAAGAPGRSGRARDTARGADRQDPDPVHDFDWLVGKWSVHHRRLKARLVGSTEWEDFGGTLVNWTTLGGRGNVGDNVMEAPDGTIRGLGLRSLDAKTGQWSVWWLDSRFPTIGPPLRGSFKNGVGTFLGDDTLHGRAITVRVIWSKITATSAHWEQAFSPDRGATWEINWTSDFTRVSN